MLFFMTGPELKAAIKRLGCTQLTFAAHCGISHIHLSRMCSGDRPVTKLLPFLIAEWSGPNPVNAPPRKVDLRNPR